MSDVTTDLAAILKTVRRPGDFSMSGAFDLLPPAIDIEGFGPLALPVLPDQAPRLITAATPAPFGRGEDTVIDTNVRRSWQIAPERVRIAGKRWAATLDAVVARAAEGLGAGAGVEAEFYKLLVYDVGSFFAGHRDTEKGRGMFATLVIALPSFSTGGDLVVRHAGREVAIGLKSDDPGEARFAAFYADCVHEVRPVETGCRVTLVYNLVRKGKKPEPPRYDREEKDIIAVLDAWRNDDTDREGPLPAKVVYPLDHSYTSAELSFAALKGADAAAAGVLASAAPRAACEIHLALLTIEESGSAEYSYSGRWREPKESDYEMTEVIDHNATLTAWRDRDGGTPGFGAMPVDEDEFSPPDICDAMIPDEQHFHEATGNEGASMERTYRRAALVIWPTAGFLPMIAAAGLPVSLPYLADLVGRCAQAGVRDTASPAQDADTLARAVIGYWPALDWWPSHGDKTTSATTLLDLLSAIKATDRLKQFLMRPGAARTRNKTDNRALIDAMSVLPAADRMTVLDHLVEDAGLLRFAMGADLLARAARAWPDLAEGDFKPVARRLLTFCPRDGIEKPGYPDLRLAKDTVAQFLRGLYLVDPPLAVDGSHALLAAPKTFDMDHRLVPALLDLIADPVLAASSAIEDLRDACLGHLTRRVARPLAPPADWARANSLTCACADCAALARFLADPTLATWSLKAVQAARSHVEATIANSHCDVDTAKARQGSPHRLVVTKNQASYDRLAKQRHQDLGILARINLVI